MKGILAALLLAGLAAATTQRAILVSYPDDTPDSVVAQGKAIVKANGGTITDEYKYIKAFGANVDSQGFEDLRIYGEKYLASIEDNGEVYALDS